MAIQDAVSLTRDLLRFAEGALCGATHGASGPEGVGWGVIKALHTKGQSTTDIAYIVGSVLIIIAVLSYYGLR